MLFKPKKVRFGACSLAVLWYELSNTSQGNTSQPRKKARPAPKTRTLRRRCRASQPFLRDLLGPPLHSIHQQPRAQGGQPPRWLLATAGELPGRKAGGFTHLPPDGAFGLLTRSNLRDGGPCPDAWKGKLQLVPFLAQRWDYRDETFVPLPSVPSRWAWGHRGTAGPCPTLEAVVLHILFSAAPWLSSCHLLVSLHFSADRYF